MPREYRLRLSKYNISNAKYRELKGFCEQYDEKRQLLSRYYEIGAQVLSDMPRGSDVSDPTAIRAERAERISSEIEMIEQSAIQADSDIYQAIIKSVCYNIPFSYLKSVDMLPCGKDKFYESRRKFFYILAKKR